MRCRLPSLNALRAFEVTARHLTITSAAKELNVTPGAISRHLSLLEDTLGVQLFIRGARRLELTSSGETYLIGVRSAFEILHSSTSDLLGVEHIRPLHVRALQTIVSRWLVPRLQRLNGVPLEISLATIGATIDFDRDNVDIAIQAGPGSQPDTVSYELLEMNIVPICNPNMVNGRPPPTDISELSEFMLLHALRPIDPQHDLWNCWAKGAQFKSLHKASRSYFPTFDMVYSAASEGLGIGIGAKCFLDEELSKGKLIIPFDLTVLFPVPYYLVIPKDKLDIPHIKVFRDWILKEAGKPIH